MLAPGQLPPEESKIIGTPMYWAPEQTYAGNTVTPGLDLWAVGVTLYVWACGYMPFEEATVMLLMAKIKECPSHVAAPAEVRDAGFRRVIEALLTRDAGGRMNLKQLRLDPWLTQGKKQPLPKQPVMAIELSPDEIANAISNRQASALSWAI